MTDIFEKISANIKDPIPVDNSLLEKVDNPQALSKFLSSNEFTLDHWRKLILGIYEADLHELFQTVTQHFLKDEIDKKGNSRPEDEEKRLTLINTIAAYYLIQASRAPEKSKRDEIFGEVMRCTSKSDTINMLHSSLFVLKGYYLFYQGTFDQAVNYFDNGREYHAKKQCVTAYVGQACVEFCKKEYMKALKLLKAAFKLNPQVPSKMKVALGYCFFTLDKVKKAQKAFEYAIESDPNNAEAYLGLAIVNKKRGDYEAYFANLEKSFSLKKDHIPTLYELAEHFLFKEDYEKTKKLATHGLRLLNKAQTIVIEKAKLASLKIDYYELKSRFNYLLGNCFHHTQNYESAMKHYLLATSLYSNNFVAQYGLGQMYINDRNWQEALTCFEHIVKNCTDTEVGECYRMLGYIYSKKLMKEEAITYYEKAVKFDNQDYECMLEYASYLEGLDNDKALLLYEKAIKIINKLNTQLKDGGNKEIPIQPETLLNLAVLRHKKGDIDQAHQELQNLLHTVESSAEDGGSEKTKGMRFTIMFNLAVILEEKMLMFDARNLHNQILEENPLYFDSYLRLANIHLTLGEFKKAEEVCSTVISKADGLFKSTKIERLKGKSVEALCMLGNMQNQIGDYTKAAQTYNQIKMKYTAEDNYSKLGIAGAYYNSSVALREIPGDQKKYLKLIGEISKSVLSLEESNFIAAMSLGITLAEVNKLSESKDVLNMLLESCQNHKNILLNMAQLEILNKRYDLAIAIFNNYLSKKSTTNNVYDPYTEASLALCYFLTKRYKEARKVYQKLILKFPDNLAYRYNLCAIYYEEAMEILRSEQRQIERTKEGVKYLKIIKQQFDFLIGSNKSKMSRYMLEEVGDVKKTIDVEIERIREYANDKTYWISTNFETFMDRLKQDEEKEKSKVKVIDDKQKRRRLQEEKERELQAQKERERQRELELEAKARAMMQKASEVAEEMKTKEVEKEKTKKIRASSKREGGGGKRKSKAEEEMDNFIDHQDEDDEAEYQEYQEGEGEGGERGGEEENDVYQDEDDEPEYEELMAAKNPEKQQQRKKEKKNRLKSLTKRREEREEGEDDEPAPYRDDEEEAEHFEPRVEKKRKLVKNSRRNIASDNEEEEETYRSGGENQENEEVGGAMEEEEAQPENEENGENGEGSPQKQDNDEEEEHY